MKAELRRIGACANPLVVIDDFSNDVAPIVDAAAALAPYPRAETYYPGLRRILNEQDGAAWDYVQATMRAVAPFISGAFDAEGFTLVEASFSMVTLAPDQLQPAQRTPHFDSTDPDYLAILHYLGGAEGTGTAFYHQRATGIERVDDRNLRRFIAAAKAEGAESEGYIAASNRYYDQVAAVEAVPDRLVIYQGSVLHSGIIPAGLPLSDDPRVGRLTANFFVKAHR